MDVEFIAFPIPYVQTVYFIEDHVYQYRLGYLDRVCHSEDAEKSEKPFESIDEIKPVLQQNRTICSGSKFGIHPRTYCNNTYQSDENLY